MLKHIDTRIVEQVKWIEDHGGTLSAYVARYGSKDDSKHYGNGGEAIYAADVGELERLTQIRNKAAFRRQQRKN